MCMFVTRLLAVTASKLVCLFQVWDFSSFIISLIGIGASMRIELKNNPRTLDRMSTFAYEDMWKVNRGDFFAW